MGCDILLKPQDLKRTTEAMQQAIEKSNVLLLPPYMHVEEIIKGARAAQITIKPLNEDTESEGGA